MKNLIGFKDIISGKYIYYVYILLISICLLSIPSVIKNIVFLTITILLTVDLILNKKIYKFSKLQCSIFSVFLILLSITSVISCIGLIATGNLFLLKDSLITIGMVTASSATALLACARFRSDNLRAIIYAVIINFTVVAICYIIALIFHIPPTWSFFRYIIPDGLEIHELAFIAGIIFVYLIATSPKKNLPYIIPLLIIILLTFKRISIAAILISCCFILIYKKFYSQRQKVSLLCRICTYIIIFGFLLCMTIYINETSYIMNNVLHINMNWRDQFYGYILTMPSPLSPLLGAGIRSTDYYLSLHPSLGFVGSIHSDILRLYLENGIIVFFAYFIIFISKIPRTFQNQKYSFIYSIVFLYSIISCLTDNLFTYYRFIFVFFVLLFHITIKVSQKNENATSRKN